MQKVKHLSNQNIRSVPSLLLTSIHFGGSMIFEQFRASSCCRVSPVQNKLTLDGCIQSSFSLPTQATTLLQKDNKHL